MKKCLLIPSDWLWRVNGWRHLLGFVIVLGNYQSRPRLTLHIGLVSRDFRYFISIIKKNVKLAFRAYRRHQLQCHHFRCDKSRPSAPVAPGCSVARWLASPIANYSDWIVVSTLAGSINSAAHLLQLEKALSHYCPLCIIDDIALSTTVNLKFFENCFLN